MPTSCCGRRRQRESLEDVGRAVLDAFSFPLAGEPLAKLVRPGGSATIVIEQPSLPIPSVSTGPRHTATATVADELVRLGVKQITILVAGGLSRRTTPREIGMLVPPDFRRRFKGRVSVHDAEADDLVDLGRAGNVDLRVNRGARRDRPRRDRHGGGDRAPRRPGGAARGERPRVAACRRRRCPCSRRARRRAGSSPSRSSGG